MCSWTQLLTVVFGAMSIAAMGALAGMLLGYWIGRNS